MEPITRQELDIHSADVPRPGKQLLCAREALDLSRDQIAAKLCLEPEVVEALERDDYDVLPASIFVKGYIRGYARLVGLNDTVLVAAYNQNVAAPLPEIKPFESEPAKEVDSGDSWVQFISYGLVAVILLSLGVWWKERWDSPEGPASIDKTLELETFSGDTAVLVPEADETVQQSDNKIEARVRPPAVEVPIVIAPPRANDLELSDFSDDFDKELAGSASAQAKPKSSPPLSPPGPSVVVPEKKAEVAVKEVPLSVSGSKEERERQTEKQPPHSSEERLSSPSLVGAKHHLVLDVEAESWVQIIGRSGRRYFDGIAKAGKSISLRGEAPFKLAIGNAPDIKLRYDGKPIDLEPVTRGRVAKFVLDGSGVRKP